jgi:hypothetical protein
MAKGTLINTEDAHLTDLHRSLNDLSVLLHSIRQFRVPDFDLYLFAFQRLEAFAKCLMCHTDDHKCQRVNLMHNYF